MVFACFRTSNDIAHSSSLSLKILVVRLSSLVVAPIYLYSASS